MNRRLILATAALVVMTAAPAGAHVTVNPREAGKGSYTKLAFRVPNERPDAGTVKLEVQMPPEHPFRSVSVKPTPGWTYTLTKKNLDEPVEDEGEEVTEYVSQITWQADKGVRVNPGEFAEFEVSVGPTPEDEDQLVFKAIQTYDGASAEVVRWIEEAEEGSDEEPERPAPVLTLVDSTAAADIDDKVAEALEDATSEGAGDLEAALAAAEDAKDDVKAAQAIAIAAGVLAAIAFLVALRRPRPAAE